MHINKLVRMARDKNPNQHLAKLSTHWAEKTELRNPVRSAVLLRRWRWFVRIDISLIILWTTITILYRPHMSSYVGSDRAPSWWLIVIVFLVGVPLAWFFTKQDDGDLNAYRDAKRFVKAVTLLELILDAPIDHWTENHDPQERTVYYLKSLALSVKVAEGVEKGEVGRRPWATPNKEKRARPKRDKFEVEFELLTTLLPVPKDRGFYYGNKGSAPDPDDEDSVQTRSA